MYKSSFLLEVALPVAVAHPLPPRSCGRPPFPHQALQMRVSVTNLFSKWRMVKQSSAERFWMFPPGRETQTAVRKIELLRIFLCYSKLSFKKVNYTNKYIFVRKGFFVFVLAASHLRDGLLTQCFSTPHTVLHCLSAQFISFSAVSFNRCLINKLLLNCSHLKQSVKAEKHLQHAGGLGIKNRSEPGLTFISPGIVNILKL